MDFDKALVIELSAITGLSKKVFPVAAPESTATPYLIYGLTRSTRLRTLRENHIGTVEAIYQLDIFHANYGMLKAIKNNVINKLESFVGRNIATTGPYIQNLSIENDFEIYENQVNQYHGVIEFTVFYEEE